MKIEKRKVADLKPWGDNPREIYEDSYERLKFSLKDLGAFIPLVVEPDGTVLGGNMRLRALAELGIEEIEVSVVEPKDDKERLKYALASNASAGRYVIEKLDPAVDAAGFSPEELGAYTIDFGNPITLADLTPEPDRKKEAEFEAGAETNTKCPKCGYEWKDSKK